MRNSSLFFIFILSWTALAADFAPTLQWVKTVAGSGNTSVTAAAADANGNLYIAGATASLDFPTTGGQATPGGSQLVRIDLAGGAATRLFPVNLPAITVTAAAPSSPGTLYAGSGNQIWKSADAGSSWTEVSQFPSGVTLSGLAVDPTNPGTVYAGTNTLGASKSTDGGVTWTAINNGIPSNSNGITAVGGMWIEPSAPNVVFAASSGGVVRSTDGGSSWTVVTGGGFYSVVALDPSTPGTLYTFDGNSGFRSSDNGQTFTPLSPLPKQASLFVLAPDPHHAGVLYAGGSGGVYQSPDGGVTWSLKTAGVTPLLVADPNSSAFYANLSGFGIVRSSDGFATTTPVGPNEPSVLQLVVTGANLFEISTAGNDVFAVKLDNNGNVVYSIDFGGSGDDAATAVALGADGSLYITGTTSSADLPVTAGAYSNTLPSTTFLPASFVLKLNPDGSLGWATYFTSSTSRPVALAVDGVGNVYVAGYSAGGLPTTPGVYQPNFQQSVTSNGFFSVIGPTAGFVTKFNPQGSGLVYSTYIPTDNQNNIVEIVQALVVDGAGNAWCGVGINPGIVPAGPNATVVKLNAAGSAVPASAVQPGLGSVASLALDAGSNVYVAGTRVQQVTTFPTTAGAFQPAPQPVVPTLPYGPASGGASDAFVAKWDSSLTHLLAATLLGGESSDAAASVAVDGSGRVIVGGSTSSYAFPTHAPSQELFSPISGFVAGFDSNLSNLLFSTYLGNGLPFAAAAALPDGSGNVLVAGATLSAGANNAVVANKVALPAAPAVRLDSVQSYASHLAKPLAPGEPIVALGAGFGSGAQIVLDGAALATVSAAATSIVAVVPDLANTSGIHTVQVSSGGTLSNPVYLPAAPVSPAIYSVDGSGAGQGYILNSDGTVNSPANPAAPGSAITIFATGAGLYTLNNGYAVASQTPAVFIDDFYCNGIAAVVQPVQGLPGNVYQLGVYIPDPAVLAQSDPDLKNFSFPAQSSIQLVMGAPDALHPGNFQAGSQAGIFINIQ